MAEIYFCHVQHESNRPFQTEINGSIVEPLGVENFVDCDCPPSSSKPQGERCDICNHLTAEHYPKDSETPMPTPRNHDR